MPGVLALMVIGSKYYKCKHCSKSSKRSSAVHNIKFEYIVPKEIGDIKLSNVRFANCKRGLIILKGT
jgi:hypothetical protein